MRCSNNIMNKFIPFIIPPQPINGYSSKQPTAPLGSTKQILKVMQYLRLT